MLSIQSIAPDMLKIAFLLKKVAENCIKKKKKHYLCILQCAYKLLCPHTINIISVVTI